MEQLQIEETRRVTRVNAKGERRKRLKCRKGFKLNADGTACVPITGSERATKRKAIRQAIRTKRSQGSGHKRRTIMRRKKAMRKRKSMGL